MKISIKKQKNETGLARVCQSPRGYEISLDGEYAGMVAPLMEWHDVKGWYFYYTFGNVTVSTCRNPLPTKEEAREEVKRQLKALIAGVR